MLTRGKAIASAVIADTRAAAVDTPRPVESRLAARASRVAVLVACDVVSLAAAALLAYLLWALPARRQSPGLYLQVAPLLTIFVAAYAQGGLYPGFGLGPVESLRRLSYATLFGFLILAAFSFALKLPPLYSRVTFFIALAASLALVPLVRAAVFHVAPAWSWWSEPVVVVGTGPRARRAICSIQQSSHFGYRPVAVLSHPGAEPPREGSVEGVPVVGDLDSAAAVAARGIRIALLETRRHDPARERPMIDRLQRHFRHVVLVREYDDLPVEGLQIRNLGNIVGIEYTNNLLLHGNQAIKRALDIVIGVAAMIAAAPIVLAAAALVLLIDGGPVWFIQDRAGLDGRRIRVPKIRTMRRDAQRRLEDYLERNPDARREWGERFKLKNDPRLIPVVGRLFRHFSVDELPQLWTVMRGDMSLVGPRPFPDYHLQRFSPAFLELRLRVRPGISGLWQIAIRSAGTVKEQESFDSYYIRNWSVWLDLYVLGRTAVAVVTGRGAY